MQAVRHLIEHGHRKIAFAGTLSQLDMRERYEGYQAALSEAGIEPDPELFFPMSCALELEGRATGRQIVALGVPFTALVACTDLNAMGIVREIRAAGYRVPEDVAVVGFDDIEAARYMDPPLATVRQGFGPLAEAAANVLLDAIIDGKPLPTTVRVPTTFIPRKSCGCVGPTPGAISLSTHPSDGPRAMQFERLLGEFYRQQAQVVALESGNDWPSKRYLATHIAEVVDGGTGVPQVQLNQVWREFLAMAPEVESVEGLVTLLEDVTNRWLGEDGADAQRILNVRAKVRELRVDFMREWRLVEQARRRYYDSITEANRRINLALIGADLETAQSLTWLEWARVSHGWLGTWTKTAQGARVLRVVSTYCRSDQSAHGVGAEQAPCEFPSPEILAELDRCNPMDIVTVIPLVSKTANRGLLTVIGPIETEIFDDTGTLGQWAALLSASMDRDELLKSLREGFERERHIAKTLRESEERYALAARGANDGLWDWSIATGDFYCSARYKAILGCGDDDMTGHVEDWFSRVHPEDLPGLKAALEDHLSGAKAHIEHEYRVIHMDGQPRWVLCRGAAVFDDEGSPVRVSG